MKIPQPQRSRLPLLITLFLMVFIFMQSALPADLSQQESNAIVRLLIRIIPVAPEALSFVIRKSAHFTEYLLLGMSLFMTVRAYLPAEDRARSSFPGFFLSGILPWIIGTLYAVTDEIHQHFVPGRSCELRDILIDSCGVAVGLAVIFLISKRYKNTEGPQS